MYIFDIADVYITFGIRQICTFFSDNEEEQIAAQIVL